ncbi:hypothetical protein [Ottowia sp.]|uniref:hypothetical protein n=1 Tax=Ottowia sp. TaxID=1898956 RepID=UPI0025D11A75|nr:hypothetical protein [Ottowia sp.]MBK6616454.1 hypothetical protein [Ottowia sp.]
MNDPTGNDTVLICESAPGIVSHSFCTREQGDAALARARATESGATSITVDDKMGIELYYSASPGFQAQVAEVGRVLKFKLDVRDALNRHRIPADRELRGSIYDAVLELRAQFLADALGSSEPRAACPGCSAGHTH